MMDIASGVSFALRREIPKKETIDGDALVALKNWVNLLSEVCKISVLHALYVVLTIF